MRAGRPCRRYSKCRHHLGNALPAFDDTNKPRAIKYNHANVLSDFLAPKFTTVTTMNLTPAQSSELAKSLKKHLPGEVLFDEIPAGALQHRRQHLSDHARRRGAAADARRRGVRRAGRRRARRADRAPRRRHQPVGTVDRRGLDSSTSASTCAAIEIDPQSLHRAGRAGRRARPAQRRRRAARSCNSDPTWPPAAAPTSAA